MKNSQQGSAKAIILAIVGVLIIVGALYLYFFKNIGEQVIPEDIVDTSALPTEEVIDEQATAQPDANVTIGDTQVNVAAPVVKATSGATGQGDGSFTTAP